MNNSKNGRRARWNVVLWAVVCGLWSSSVLGQWTNPPTPGDTNPPAGFYVQPPGTTTTYVTQGTLLTDGGSRISTAELGIGLTFDGTNLNATAGSSYDDSWTNTYSAVWAALLAGDYLTAADLAGYVATTNSTYTQTVALASGAWQRGEAVTNATDSAAWHVGDSLTAQNWGIAGGVYFAAPSAGGNANDVLRNFGSGVTIWDALDAADISAAGGVTGTPWTAAGYLSADGDGSSLTNMTAAQVGALSTNGGTVAGDILLAGSAYKLGFTNAAHIRFSTRGELWYGDVMPFQWDAGGLYGNAAGLTNMDLSTGTNAPAAWTADSNAVVAAGTGGITVVPTTNGNSITYTVSAGGSGSGDRMAFGLSPGAALSYGSTADAVLYGVVGANSSWDMLAFSDTTTNRARWVIPGGITARWTGAAITNTVRWYAASATSNAVVWSLAYKTMSTNQTIDAAYSTAILVTNTTASTATNMNAVTVVMSPTTNDFVAGQPTLVEIKRVPGDAGDTMAGDANIMDVSVW